MRRILRILLWTTAAVVCLAAGLALYLRNADLNIYQEQVEAYLSDKIGHDFDIDGRFDLQVRGDIRLTAEQVTLANPRWPGDPALASVGHFSVAIDFWSLFAGPVFIRELEVRDVEVSMRQSPQGMNWDTGRPARQSPQQVNTELVAFRDVSVENVAFEYTNPDRNVSINVGLDFLTVSPDENDILDLDLRGAINEFPLWADGRLGPWQHLVDGKNLTADLDLTLGQLQLAMEGAAEDFVRLQGVEATLSLSGPSIERITDRLGLPPFARGAYQLDGELRRGDGGNQVSINGELGDIQVIANGTIDSLRRPRNTAYDFNVSGPDARYISELFGVDGVPPVEFNLTGDFARSNNRLSFSGTRARLGENAVAVDGWLQVHRESTDLDLMIDAEGPDFRVFAPFIGAEKVPELGFDISGRLLKTGMAWQFDDVVAEVGENRFAATGAMARGKDTEVSFTASGPDNSFLHGLANLQGLPPRPYEVTANVRHERSGIRVDGLQASFGEHRIDIDGLIGTDDRLAGTEIDVTLRGPDLRNVSLLTRVPYLPDGPYYVGGSLRLERDMLYLDDVVAVVEDLHAQADGSVGLAARNGEFDLDLRANGPDVAGLANLAWTDRMAGSPFSIGGRIRHEGADYQLQKFEASMGEVNASLDGTLSIEPLSNDSDLRFSIAGPDLDALVSAFELDVFFPARPFSVSGQFNGTPSGFSMQDFVATIGDNDAKGQFNADLTGKPEFSGRLSSTFLDLTDRLQQPATRDAEPRQPQESGLFFSTEPLETGRLHAANLFFELDVAKLVANQASITDLRLGFELRDGGLSVAPFSFRDVDGSFEATLQLLPRDQVYALSGLVLANNVRIGTLGSEDQERARRPPLDGQIELRGVGRSLHEIMASANGKVSLRQGRGQIPNRGARIFGDLVLEIIRTFNPLRSKDKYRRLDCGIYEISITDGVAKIDELAIQTDHLTTLATGKVNLLTEEIDMGVRAKPREGFGVSIGGLTTSFVKIGGTLKSPDLVFDTKGAATTTGVAVATGGLSLLAKGLADRLSAAVDICDSEKSKEQQRQGSGAE